MVDNEIPTGIATAGGIVTAGGVKQEDELLSLANRSWKPVIPSSSSPEEDDGSTATEMLAEVSAATNVPMPSALDLSQITPKPIYVPETQPEHLHHKKNKLSNDKRRPPWSAMRRSRKTRKRLLVKATKNS